LLKEVLDELEFEEKRSSPPELLLLPKLKLGVEDEDEPLLPKLKAFPLLPLPLPKLNKFPPLPLLEPPLLLLLPLLPKLKALPPPPLLLLPLELPKLNALLELLLVPLPNEKSGCELLELPPLPPLELPKSNDGPEEPDELGALPPNVNI